MGARGFLPFGLGYAVSPMKRKGRLAHPCRSDIVVEKLYYLSFECLEADLQEDFINDFHKNNGLDPKHAISAHHPKQASSKFRPRWDQGSVKVDRNITLICSRTVWCRIVVADYCKIGDQASDDLRIDGVLDRESTRGRRRPPFRRAYDADVASRTSRSW